MTYKDVFWWNYICSSTVIIVLFIISLNIKKKNQFSMQISIYSKNDIWNNNRRTKHQHSFFPSLKDVYQHKNIFYKNRNISFDSLLCQSVSFDCNHPDINNHLMLNMCNSKLTHSTNLFTLYIYWLFVYRPLSSYGPYFLF